MTDKPGQGTQTAAERTKREAPVEQNLAVEPVPELEREIVAPADDNEEAQYWASWGLAVPSHLRAQKTASKP